MDRQYRRAALTLCVVGAICLSIAACRDSASPPGSNADSMNKGEHTMAEHPYIGLWVTADNRVRHELLANGRYDEARGDRESAYQGRYEVTGTRIEYWDDTGFTADGDFVSLDELHHGGMILRRVQP